MNVENAQEKWLKERWWGLECTSEVANFSSLVDDTGCIERNIKLCNLKKRLNYFKKSDGITGNNFLRDYSVVNTHIKLSGYKLAQGPR